jgi:hypothetical protein
MEKTSAAKLEGMMVASRMYLHAVADYVRENIPEHQRRTIMLKIGAASAELIDVSRMIHDEHPDLDPHREQTELATRLRNNPSSGSAG